MRTRASLLPEHRYLLRAELSIRPRLLLPLSAVFFGQPVQIRQVRRFPYPTAVAFGVLSLGGNNTKSAVTGPDGRFSFTGLNAGSYQLLVTATGFAHQEYGLGPRGHSRALAVNATQPTRDLVIRLAANGSIGGRIVDENRKPATNASIYVVQTHYSDQGQTLESVGEEPSMTVETFGSSMFRRAGTTCSQVRILDSSLECYPAAGQFRYHALRCSTTLTRPTSLKPSVST